MVTLNNLRSQSSKDLAKFARSEGIPGWHNMRKEQLIQALTRLLKRRGQPVANLRPASTSKASSKPAAKKIQPAVAVKSTAAKSSAVAKPAAKPTIAKPVVASKAAKPPTDPRNSNLQKPTKPVPVRAEVAEKPKPPSAVAVQMQSASLERERLKNLALSASLNKDKQSVSKDRVILIVRDSFWLQAYWEVTEQTVRRAKTALEKHWRGAVPVLRLFEFSDDDDQTPEKPIRDIEVHGGVDTWFVDTLNPPKSYRVAIGYAAPNGRFYMIAKSNKVTTPVPSGHPSAGNWADIAQDCENFFALSGGYVADNDSRELQEVFEEKLRRPMAPLNPSTAIVLDPRKEFQFEVDAQMVVYGVAAPGSSVTLAGEPLKIDPDGTFSVRMDLPDKRQVLPVVASSRDGAHQRTTVLSIERNTKVMEPVNMDIDEP
ncbi:MAG: DUF4912 domain-containing protein [Planctomycetota bacterium]